MLQQLRSNRAIFSVSVLAITLGMGMVACQDEPELAEPEAVVPEAETEVAAGDADVALEDLDV